MTRKAKLTKEDCEQIAKLINEGHEIKDLAKKFGVHRSVISRRCKAMYQSKKIPVETRNKVIKATPVNQPRCQHPLNHLFLKVLERMKLLEL